MRYVLRQLALIALLIILYGTGNGQVISDAASALNSFIRPSTQNASSCHEGSYYPTLAYQDALKGAAQLLARSTQIYGDYSREVSR